MYRQFLLLLSFLILSISPTPAQKEKSSEIAKKADEYLSRLVPFGLNGCVLISKNEKIVLNLGYGFSDSGKQIRNTPNTVFSLGSIVKPFTATLIMKLVQDKKIDLDDPLSKYFTDVPPDKANIEINQLLSHSSGLPDAVGSDTEFISKEDFLTGVWQTPTEFSPGENYLYSNVGFSLLAMIIEEVTGMEYEAYLKKTILEPAGMSMTGYSNENWIQENIAHNYADGKDNGTFLDREYYPTWHLIGNGGILSTTSDMYKFYLFIKGHKLLNEESKKIMWTPVFMDDAFGWVNIDNGEIIQHNGGSSDGNGAVMKWYPKDDIFMMIFTNSTIDGQPGFTMIEQPMENILFGDEVPLPPVVIPYKDLISEDIQGTYRSGEQIKFTVRMSGKNVKLFPDTQNAVNLFLNDNVDSPYLQNDWNKKVEDVLNRVLQDEDFEPLKSICDEPEKLRNSIANEMKMEGYQHPKARSLYSLAIDNDMTKTLVAISDDDFQGVCMLFHMVFRSGRFVGLGVDFGMPTLPSILLVPTAKNAFIGYDFNTNYPVEFEYKTDKSGKIASILLEDTLVEVLTEN